MKSLLKVSSVVFAVGFLTACQNKIDNPEMKQCAQQNYQCETSCEQQSTAEGMLHRVCSDKCIEAHNQCKANAQSLGEVQ